MSQFKICILQLKVGRYSTTRENFYIIKLLTCWPTLV